MAVAVEGLRELNRAFARAPNTLDREWRSAQRSIGEPVRQAAESRAAVEIGEQPWSRMRVGVTRRAVYVAPRQRGSKTPARKRPNLAGLLMERAMQPALDAKQGETLRRLEHVLATVGRDWER